MMAVREAHRMGYRTVVLDPAADCPASNLATEIITADFTDQNAAELLSTKSDVVTYEFENVNAETVEHIERTTTVRPDSTILRMAQNRRLEKEELARRGFPTVRFLSAQGRSEIEKSISTIGLPVVIKTATSGYDGKGQAVLKTQDDVKAFRVTAGDGVLYVIEEFLSLHCELSVIAVRSAEGVVTSFPVSQNEHRDNILHKSVVPAPVPGPLIAQAELLGRTIIESFGMVGVLCIEMFVTRDGRLLVNELAPRPHNSGHYTIDACSISQFEALVRAVCGLPIPQPRLLAPCTMINILGKHLQRLDMAQLLQTEGAKLHLYGKTKSEPKRKMGHITVLGTTPEEVKKKTERIEQLIGEHSFSTAD